MRHTHDRRFGEMRDMIEGWRAMRGEGRGHGRPGFGGGGFEPRFGRGGGHFGGRGGGRRRMFDAGELRLVMLALMEGQARHGYDLIREIESRTGGAYAPSPGIVYPTLTLLEELGQIEAAAADGGKRLFSLTASGQAHLEENRALASAALARLEALKSEASAMEAGPIWRAMQNLRAVVQQRTAGAPDKALQFSVADLLDEVARKIERL